MTALLALHIEAALDPAETDLVRSMAKISISQVMLVLTQGKEIPVLRRALPVFEEILVKRNLDLKPPSAQNQHPSAELRPQSQLRDDSVVHANALSSNTPTRPEQSECDPLFEMDFLGFDFLDDGQFGHLDFIGQH